MKKTVMAVLLASTNVAYAAPTRVTMNLDINTDVLIKANKTVALRAQCYKEDLGGGLFATKLTVYTQTTSSIAIQQGRTKFYGPPFVPSVPALFPAKTQVTPDIIAAADNTFLFQAGNAGGDTTDFELGINVGGDGFILDTAPGGKGLTYDESASVFAAKPNSCYLTLPVDKFGGVE